MNPDEEIILRAMSGMPASVKEPFKRWIEGIIAARDAQQERVERLTARCEKLKKALPPSATLRSWFAETQQRRGKITGDMLKMLDAAVLIDEVLAELEGDK